MLVLCDITEDQFQVWCDIVMTCCCCDITEDQFQVWCDMVMTCCCCDITEDQFQEWCDMVMTWFFVCFVFVVVFHRRTVSGMV